MCELKKDIKDIPGDAVLADGFDICRIQHALKLVHHVLEEHSSDENLMEGATWLLEMIIPNLGKVYSEGSKLGKPLFMARMVASYEKAE